MSKRCGIALALLFAVLMQSSCGLFKRGIHRSNNPAKDTTLVVAIPVTTDSARADTALSTLPVPDARQEMIDALTPAWKHVPSFVAFTGKAKMHYEGRGQRQDFTTIFRIKNNEAIWASVIALGGIVQVARLYITPDSLKLINYLDKEVTEMPLSEASKVLPAPADFATLQNLIMGAALKTQGMAEDAVDLGSMLTLQVSDETLSQQVNFNKADTTIASLQMQAGSNAALSGIISFSDYQIINGQKFPMNRDINVINAGEQYKLEMNFTKAEFTDHVDFPFSIPRSYKRK